MQYQPIYYIENRGWYFIYHFLVFMIGGLRHIQPKKPILYIPYMKENLLDADRDLLVALSQRGDNDQSGPMREGKGKFSYSSANINYEIMNFLKDIYTFVDSLAIVPNPTELHFIYNHGEPVTLHDYGVNVHPDTFPFLRQLFLQKLPNRSIQKGKYIYITRKDSENITGNFGVRKRQVLNENELVPMLDEFGFQYVNLETLPLEKKLELFQTSEIILSPNSGALTFSFLANTKATVIELMPEFKVGEYKQEWKQEQYKEMCEAVGVPYIRFQKMTYIEDELNMKVDVGELKSSLLTLQ